jgi:hypothetical protein
MRKIFTALVLFGVMFAEAGVVYGTETTPTAVRDLRQAFAGNRAEADARYLGETVPVTGVVLSTGISRYMTPTVMLSDHAGGELYVICVLPRLDVGKLSDFEPGQSVAMIGRVYRLSERGVVLKECKAAE